MMSGNILISPDEVKKRLAFPSRKIRLSGFGSTHPPVGNPFRLQADGD